MTKLNETKFIGELKKSFAYCYRKEQHLPLFWKLRGTAATSGRPDILIINKGYTFFIETKVKKATKSCNVLSGVTALQRANLLKIVSRGGIAYVCVQIAKDIAIVVDLNKYYETYSEMPEKLNINLAGKTFLSFVITKSKAIWDVTEFDRRNKLQFVERNKQ